VDEGPGSKHRGRVLTDDDPVQVRSARNLLASDDTFRVSMSVVLETGRVLEAVYDLERSIVSDSLRRFFGLPQVEVDRPHHVADALPWYEDGRDFADAVHLALSQDADRLATFDQARARDTSERGSCGVVPVDGSSAYAPPWCPIQTRLRGVVARLPSTSEGRDLNG